MQRRRADSRTGMPHVLSALFVLTQENLHLWKLEGQYRLCHAGAGGHDREVSNKEGTGKSSSHGGSQQASHPKEPCAHSSPTPGLILSAVHIACPMGYNSHHLQVGEGVLRWGRVARQTGDRTESLGDSSLACTVPGRERWDPSPVLSVF